MKTQKYVLRWLALLLLIVTVIGVTVAGAAEVETVSDDVISLIATPKIYIRKDNATPVEVAAAEELQAYLTKITGTPFEIVPSNISLYKKGIFVGATAQAENAGVEACPNKNGNGEGWAIEVVGDGVYLTGGAGNATDRGVLYAAYHLLEDVLGVRWWNLWEEYVPSDENPTISATYKESGEPAFA